MKPEFKSQKLLSITRSKAKMYEYFVPEDQHIRIIEDPAELFFLTIGILGEIVDSFDASKNHRSDLKEALKFSAKFFDSYAQSRFDKDYDDYLLLLGAASYYVCDMQGSSLVLIKKIKDEIDVEGDGLETAILWLLRGDYDLNKKPKFNDSCYKNSLLKIVNDWAFYFMTGHKIGEIRSELGKLKKEVYRVGTPRHLLLVDVLFAISAKKYLNSSWYAIPRNSGLSAIKWSKMIGRKGFIQELWPAQHLIGEKGIFKGASAIIQMPTSAGKTKATELIVRSAFLSGRTKSAIIVAPFRSLCHEIRSSFIKEFEDDDVRINEISDVSQSDVDLDELLSLDKEQIIIITPEKLLYLLRQNSDFLTKVGLIIFDEGHQFDSGTRGITYELLLTSLKKILPLETQKVLISAVINNAEVVGEWLNGKENIIVSGLDLATTHRTVGFISWLDSAGQIKFVNDQDIDRDEFFVPYIVRKESLNDELSFPNKEDNQSIALYLGLKLVPNGSIAIFCGNKKSPKILIKKTIDLYNHNYSSPSPKTYSSEDEIIRLAKLFEINFGKDDVAVKGAKLGIFSHHSGIPQGLRLAIEGAMRKDLIKFVICTSTLAQGVNLPIRYLILTGVYQAGEVLKVRDFHNLMGRAGRAGMYTEGGILFADTEIYDKKNKNWELVRSLMKADNIEPCVSNLLSIFDPFLIKVGRYGRSVDVGLDVMAVLSLFLGDSELFMNGIFAEIIIDAKSKYPNATNIEDDLNNALQWKIHLLAAVQNFLLSQIDINENIISPEKAEELSRETLAHHLGDEGAKNNLSNLFKLIADSINNQMKNAAERKVYGKTLFGVKQAKEINDWLVKNLGSLYLCEDEDALLKALWPLFLQQITQRSFRNCNSKEILLSLTMHWIGGESFSKMFGLLQDGDAKIISGPSRRRFSYTVEDTVGICEYALSYEGTLVLNAVIQFIEHLETLDENEYPYIIGMISILQKRLKYGVRSKEEIAFCELGFVDRSIVAGMADIVGEFGWDRDSAIIRINAYKDELSNMFESLPFYYRDLLDRFIKK